MRTSLPQRIPVIHELLLVPSDGGDRLVLVEVLQPRRAQRVGMTCEVVPVGEERIRGGLELGHEVADGISGLRDDDHTRGLISNGTGKKKKLLRGVGWDGAGRVVESEFRQRGIDFARAGLLGGRGGTNIRDPILDGVAPSISTYEANVVQDEKENEIDGQPRRVVAAVHEFLKLVEKRAVERPQESLHEDGVHLRGDHAGKRDLVS